MNETKTQKLYTLQFTAEELGEIQTCCNSLNVCGAGPDDPAVTAWRKITEATMDSSEEDGGAPEEITRECKTATHTFRDVFSDLMYVHRSDDGNISFEIEKRADSHCVVFSQEQAREIAMLILNLIEEPEGDA